jgi:DNA-directed RNA polymerase specialized sigma24 family protein
MAPAGASCDRTGRTILCYRWGVSSDALDWLHGDDAERGARRELERLRLPASLADDVLQDARLRVWRTGARRSEPPENPVAYAYRALQHAALDLYRRQRRRVAEVALDEPWPGPDGTRSDVDVPGEFEDGCRRAAHGALAVRPWAGAAALNLLTFALHPDVPIPPEAPRPDAGTDDQEASWAALWLAGKLDCFPAVGSAEDAAMRKRRSRALDDAARHLRRAFELAGGTAP